MTERDREQRPCCPELTVVRLRLIEIPLSIVATLLAIRQVF